MLGLLQFRHARRRIWDAGHCPCRVDDDCFPGVIRHDDPAIPGHDLERAVRQVLVRDGAVIQERVVTARGLAFLYGGESQCGERQDADPAISRAASDACERRIDPEAAGLGYLAGNEGEGALRETEQGRIRVPIRVICKLVQYRAGVARQIEHGAIGEDDSHRAIGSGRYRVALVDELADVHSSNNAAGAHDGDRTDRRLDLADGIGRRGDQPLRGAEHNAVHTKRIAGATEHGDPPRLMTVPRPGWLGLCALLPDYPERDVPYLCTIRNSN